LALLDRVTTTVTWPRRPRKCALGWCISLGLVSSLHLLQHLALSQPTRRNQKSSLLLKTSGHRTKYTDRLRKPMDLAGLSLGPTFGSARHFRQWAVPQGWRAGHMPSHLLLSITTATGATLHDEVTSRSSEWHLAGSYAAIPPHPATTAATDRFRAASQIAVRARRRTLASLVHSASQMRWSVACGMRGFLPLSL
jgi:hypothetical protein